MKLKAQKGKGKEKAEQAEVELKSKKPLKKGKDAAKATPIVKKTKDKKVVAPIKEGKQKKKAAPVKASDDDDDEEEEEEENEESLLADQEDDEVEDAENDSDEEDEDDEDEENESIKNKNGLIEEEAEEDDGEGDDDEDDEEEDEEEDGDDDEEEPSKLKVTKKGKKTVKAAAEEQDDDSDDAPEETAIAKKPVVSDAVPLVDFRRIPKGTPNENILFIKNLPAISEFDKMEVATIFSKFGVIKALFCYATGRKSNAMVAFETPEAAQAALETNGKAKIGKNVLSVSLKKTLVNPNSFNQELTVSVNNLKNTTTVEALKEFFKNCGELTNAATFGSQNPFGLVEFKNSEDLEKALKLSGTELDGAILDVKRKGRITNDKDEEHTIALENQQNLTSFEEEKLRKIFAKCGEIRSVELLCKKQVLAFITFVEPESVGKALALDGKTEEGLELQIKKYSSINLNKLIIFIKNIAENVQESELRKLFERCGEVGTIKQNPNFKTATVQFNDKDAFCKSFLLNEHFFGNTPIFIQPFSIRKAIFSKKKRQFETKRLNARRHIGKPYGQQHRTPFGGQQQPGGFQKKFGKKPANSNGDANPAPFYRQNTFNNNGKRPFKPQHKQQQGGAKRPKPAETN